MNAESHRCVSLYLQAYHYSLERIESEMHGITYYGATTLNNYYYYYRGAAYVLTPLRLLARPRFPAA